MVRLEEETVVKTQWKGQQVEEEHSQAGIEKDHGVLQRGEYWGRERGVDLHTAWHLLSLTCVAQEGEVYVVEESCRPHSISYQTAEDVGLRQDWKRGKGGSGRRGVGVTGEGWEWQERGGSGRRGVGVTGEGWEWQERGGSDRRGVGVAGEGCQGRQTHLAMPPVESHTHTGLGGTGHSGEHQNSRPTPRWQERGQASSVHIV